MFIPNQIYYEKEIENFELGKKLLKQYENISKARRLFFKKAME